MSVAAGLDPEERRARRKARAWALQVHYRWEAGGHEGTLVDALTETMETRRVGEARLPHLRRILRAMDAHLGEVDRMLVSHLENWRLDRLSNIDRGVLRIAATEILHLSDVPGPVAVAEGVRLAERYGGEQSARFVNGVLDALRRSRADAG